MQNGYDTCAARFRDQVALVVGGAQGIGKAIAQRLAKEGAEVALADVDLPEMEATLAELSRVGLPGACSSAMSVARTT